MGGPAFACATDGTIRETMQLQPLLELIAASTPLREAASRLNAGRPLTLGVSDAAKLVTASALWHRLDRPLLLLVPREVDAESALDQLRMWVGPDALHFPARGGLPYERSAGGHGPAQRRIQVLAKLANAGAARRPPLIVASAAAVAEPTLGPADLGRGPGLLRVGDRAEIATLAAQLVEAGYEIEPIVQSPGEAARRGGLVDVYPPDSDLPFRIELFGPQIESIRSFDISTQRTVEQLDAIRIGPASEWFPSQLQLHRVAGWLRDATDDEVRQERAALGRGELPAPGRYGPLAVEGSLLDHLGDAAILIDEREAIDTAMAELDELAVERRAELVGRGELGTEAPLPHRSASAFTVTLEQSRYRAELSRWATERDPDTLRLPFQTHDAYAGRLPAAADDAARQQRRGDRIVIVTQQAQRYREVLADAGVEADVVTALEDPPAPGSLALLQGALPAGWRLPLADGQLALATDRELFGFVKQRRTLRRGSARSKFLAEVAPGDFVVHADHGIARFAGITRREVSGEQRDYLELRYAGGDRLYVPVDHVDRVSRYVGPSEHTPRLTRLGTQEWRRTRAKVRAQVAEAAADLLRLYAARRLLRGHAFPPDTEWQREMEAAFPYEETEDQARAIADVKADMESALPMDRVVCGDVGFGKTEVAIRAAFKAVQDGYQVAFLVPTTVLAQQHERTFRERLAAFPVRIGVLSRFRSDGETRETLAGLAAGTVDIVIGTHRLLQADVEFANLGLVVIDEEQRFGVNHKERLKRMRLEVDVLTLSATPIPRTLHMSLTGIRDMSTMEHAPLERQPVQTYVSEWDEALVREAILLEIERGGQAFLVHNRVQTIDQLAERMRILVPEARIAVAHGQLPERTLQRVMESFADGEFDLLICTTIIESGIDIPNANTLIVDRADRLGLAQLYQLRGRVGRASNRAYAYLFHPRDHVLSEIAQRRLATIFEASELGAGFQVALRDLEIRGAGNLLGSAQSGQIAAVGFDLYMQMLGEEVERLKPATDGEAPTGTAAEGAPPGTPEARALAIDLPISAFIPERYIEDIEARLALYQRIAALTDREGSHALEAETADRFGPLPEPLQRFFGLVRVRLAAMAAAVDAVRVEGHELVIAARDAQRFHGRSLPSLPRFVRRGRTQLRMERADLGADWAEALPALEAILDGLSAHPTPARQSVPEPQGADQFAEATR